MARLHWNQETHKKYEVGVDRGVFYPKVGLAEPWNGLISVAESSISEGVSSYYLDGVKYYDDVPKTLPKMTITAMVAPSGLQEALGNESVIPGFILTKQKKKEFGFSYRTQLGNGLGYKIHLLYNAIATSSNQKSSTLTDTNNLESQSWVLNTTPITYPGIGFISHIVFDSTKMIPEQLDFLEAIIYGDDKSNPRLPTIFELANLFERFEPYHIIYSSTGYSTFISGMGDLVATKINGILSIFYKSRLKAEENSSFYRLEY